MGTVLRQEPAVIPPTANMQDTDASRLDRFRAIDTWLREYENRTHDWPMLAKMCIECETEKLWLEGGHTSWDDWVRKAAPRSARSIYYHKAVYLGLLPDFSVEEMRQMKPETAKVVRKLSKAARADEAVRSAALGSPKREFVQVVQETHPLEHIEEDCLLRLTESVMDEFSEAFERYVESDEGATHSDFVLFLVREWGDR